MMLPCCNGSPDSLISLGPLRHPPPLPALICCQQGLPIDYTACSVYTCSDIQVANALHPRSRFVGSITHFDHSVDGGVLAEQPSDQSDNSMICLRVGPCKW